MSKPDNYRWSKANWGPPVPSFEFDSTVLEDRSHSRPRKLRGSDIVFIGQAMADCIDCTGGDMATATWLYTKNVSEPTYMNLSGLIPRYQSMYFVNPAKISLMTTPKETTGSRIRNIWPDVFDLAPSPESNGYDFNKLSETQIEAIMRDLNKMAAFVGPEMVTHRSVGEVTVNKEITRTNRGESEIPESNDTFSAHWTSRTESSSGSSTRTFTSVDGESMATTHTVHIGGEPIEYPATYSMLDVAKNRFRLFAKVYAHAVRGHRTDGEEVIDFPFTEWDGVIELAQGTIENAAITYDLSPVCRTAESWIKRLIGFERMYPTAGSHNDDLAWEECSFNVARLLTLCERRDHARF